SEGVHRLLRAARPGADHPHLGPAAEGVPRRTGRRVPAGDGQRAGGAGGAGGGAGVMQENAGIRPASRGTAMKLIIELSPELEQRLAEEAAQHGQPAEEFARAVLEERLAAPTAKRKEAQRAQNQRAITLLRQWSVEDAAQPDPDPVPEIPPLSLREVE